MKPKHIIPFLTLSLILSFGLTSVSSATYTPTSIDDLLAPYQAVIDKLNDEYDCSVYIPADQKDTVYNNIKDRSPYEFEADLRNQLINTINSESTSIPNVTITQDDFTQNDTERVLPEGPSTYDLPPAAVSDPLIVTPVIDTRSVRENIVQKYYLDQAAYIKLYSTVFSGSGSAGTFTYSNIEKLTSGWDAGSGTFFYVPRSYTYSLDSSKKNCTVVLPCDKRNDDGLFLTGYWTVTVIFNAG